MSSHVHAPTSIEVRFTLFKHCLFPETSGIQGALISANRNLCTLKHSLMRDPQLPAWRARGNKVPGSI